MAKLQKSSSKEPIEKSKVKTSKVTDDKVVVKKKRRDTILVVKEQNTLLPFLIERPKDQIRTTVKSLLSHNQITIKNRVIKKFDHLLNPDVS